MKRLITILTLSLYCAISYTQDRVDTILAKIPFRLSNNHIYLNLPINNSKPLWFILDTGAPSIVDLRQSKNLNLELYAPQKGYGIGNAPEDVSFTKSISFQINNVNFLEKDVAVVSLATIEECVNRYVVDIMGNIISQEKKIKRKSQYQPIDGILGANFFKSFVVEIDYKHQYVVLHDSETYHYDGAGKIIPIEITANHIFTYASIQSTDNTNIKGRFMIDTGSMLAILFTTSFIKRYNLLPAPSQTKPVSLCGLGGSSQAQIGTIGKLSMQDVSVNQLPAVFSQATGGVLASSEFDGHIGNAVLRHFNVIFDYSRSRMILE